VPRAGRALARSALRAAGRKVLLWLAGTLGVPAAAFGVVLLALFFVSVTLLGLASDESVASEREACRRAAEEVVPEPRSADGCERAYELPWGILALAWQAAGGEGDPYPWVRELARDLAPKVEYRESEVVTETVAADGTISRSVRRVELVDRVQTYRGIYRHRYRRVSESLPGGGTVSREVADGVSFTPDFSLLEEALRKRGLDTSGLEDFVQFAESVTWGTDPGLDAEGEDVVLGGALGSSLPVQFRGEPGGKIWPLEGPITSPFGMRVHPVYGKRRMHTGIDIAAPAGTPVRAALGGRVAHAGWAGELGLAVALDHGDGQFTVYGHLSKVLVEAGQTVRTGEVLGLVGSTGTSTGPHLHFAVWEWGRPVDPLKWLP